MNLIYAGITGQFEKQIRALVDPIGQAVTKAVRDTGVQVLKAGQAQLKGAFGGGYNHGSLVAKGLYKIDRPKGQAYSIDATVTIAHRWHFMGIFETGANISGPKLLWIPAAGVPAIFNGHAMNPRNFRRFIGKLELVRIPGFGVGAMLMAPVEELQRLGVTPNLGNPTIRKLTRLAKLRGNPRRGWAVVFIGIDSASISKHTSLFAIFDKAQANLASLYAANIAAQKL